MPVNGAFELSPLCNCACDMCYVRKSRIEVDMAGGLIPYNQWLELAREGMKSGLTYLLLTGGEPFIYPDFDLLYIALSRLGLVLSINTNGTQLSEEHFEMLNRHRPCAVNVTAYGASDDTYKKLCHIENGFQKFIATLERLVKMNINVAINYSATPANKLDAKAIHDIGKHFGVPVRTNAYMYPARRRDIANIGTNFRLSPSEAAEMKISCEEYCMGEKAVSSVAEFFAHTPDEQCNIKNDNSSDKLRCMACRSSFCVSWQGKMTGCAMLDRPFGFPFEQGFESAWQTLSTESEQIRTAKKCTECELRGICNHCAAIALCETGSYDKVPEYLCEMSKALNNQMKLKLRS